MANSLLTGALFETDLYNLAIVDKELQEKESILLDEIKVIQQSVEDELTPYRKQVDDIKSKRQELMDRLIQQVEEYLDTARNAEHEKQLRKKLHHLVTVRTNTIYNYDADEAREKVIQNKDWRFINKPTLSKSKIQAAMKTAEIDWLDYEIETKRFVKVGKLGELLIMLEAMNNNHNDISKQDSTIGDKFA